MYALGEPMKTNSFVESTFKQQDMSYEVPLRPSSLADFIGQGQIREQLEVLIGAALERGDALGHCLFSGPPGLGKTTLSHILSKMMGTDITVTSGPVIEKAGDLAGILTNLKKGDILFIDEIHRMPRAVEEYLYSAMEDFELDLLIDSGPNARSVKVKLNRFSLVGATTRLGLLTAPLRSRFGFVGRLDYYELEAMSHIIKRTAKMLKMEMDEASIQEIAMRSRGTPRVANNLVRWVRDFTQMRYQGIVSQEATCQALSLICIDDKGLDEMDCKILEALIDRFQGGPVGIKTIALAVGEEAETLEEVHEPFLIMQGMIQRTLRGREATALAYQHLNKTKEKRHVV